jgi:hypothetical protein
VNATRNKAEDTIMNRTLPYCLTLLLLFAAMPLAAQFTYQGQLKQSGAPFTGTAEMVFTLWTEAEGGLQVGNTLSQSVPVAGGLFQTELDFGNAFGHDPRWLQIQVAGNTLDSRQRLTPAPVALYAFSAPGDGSGSHWTLSGGQLSYNGRVNIGSDPEETNLSVTGALRAETNSIFARTAISGITSGGGYAVGVYGIGGGTGSGVIGTHNDSSGTGVTGLTTSGSGVFGQASGTSGTNQGVLGFSSSPDGYGVRGRNTSDGAGVKGQGNFIGVEGDGPIGFYSDSGHIGGLFASETGYGVNAIGPWGIVASSNEPDGYAGYFSGPAGSRNYFQRQVGIGTVDPEAMLHIVDTTGDSFPHYLRITDGTDTKFAVFSNGIILGPGTVGSSLYLNNFVSGGQTSVCKYTTTGNAQVGTLARCSSSARYKEDIADFKQAGNLISRLRAVSYRWIADGQADLGLVAEEVAKIEPRLVTYNEGGEVEGVKYDRLAAVLVRAFQEEQTTNRETIAELNAHNHALQAELAAIRHETETRLALLEELLLGSQLAAGKQ